MLAEYEQALEIGKQQLSLVKNRKVFGMGLITAHLILAETYIHLGRQKDARKHATEISRIAPGFSLAEFSKSTFYTDASQLETRLEVLRKAGLK